DPTRPLAVMKSCGVKAEDVAYFGDTAVDMETARNANFLAVGVTWGFRSRSELESSGAQIIVDSPAEILERVNFG
ncbi:MAG: HAD family hydrolase, partial [Selenomonadaceae bacterium]|nr:HAD family hydrolase [Selenomonadaceae bacterium]